MAQATRVGDLNTGHGSYRPVPLVSGSNNVIINGKLSGRINDTYATHCAPNSGCHIDIVSQGSSTVLINGRRAARVGDQTGAAKVAQGSNNVIIGG